MQHEAFFNNRGKLDLSHHTYPDQNTSLCSLTHQKWGCIANPRAYHSTAQRLSLTQKLHKFFGLLAIFAQGPVVNTERKVTGAITGGKHEGGRERALSKQEVVVG